MSEDNQPRLIANFLKEASGKQFTANEIAASLYELYPDRYKKKQRRAGFETEKQLIAQISSEIGAHKKTLAKYGVAWQDLPRPRRYFYPGDANADLQPCLTDAPLLKPYNKNSPEQSQKREEDLYFPIMDYLTSEFDISCMRVNEKTSRNSRGPGGNRWLHPDLVAMQPIDREWAPEVKECLKMSRQPSARLWSFEVKRELTLSNLREYFFQTVSNSSWANEGYLVATSINNKVLNELRILSGLHGIGVILFNQEEPDQSEILLQSAQKPDVDWQTVNRIVEENSDFSAFIADVLSYFMTGRDHIRERWEWLRKSKLKSSLIS